MKFPVTRVKRSPNVADLHGRLGKLGGRATWWYFRPNIAARLFTFARLTYLLALT